MRRLRMGVIGCGGIAQMMHLPHMAEYDDRFEIVALADTHAPTLRAVGEKFHVSERYTDWRELVNRPDIDTVAILHSGSHRETTLASLDAGKDVFVEKPLGWNVREVDEIADRVAQTDRIVQVGYHKRYDPGYRYACEQIKQMRDLGFARITVLHPDDQLGWSMHRVRRGDGQILEGHRPPSERLEDVMAGAQQALAEGDLASLVDEALGARRNNNVLRTAYGMMTVSLIHQTYTLFGMLGAPSRVISTELWRGGLSMHVIIEYPQDVRVALDWHYLGHLKDYKEEYAFFGNHDRVYLTFPAPYFDHFPTPVTIQGHEGELTWEKRVIVNYEEAFARELLAFYDNVIKRRSPETSAEEARQHARFIQAMIDAAR